MSSIPEEQRKDDRDDRLGEAKEERSESSELVAFSAVGLLHHVQLAEDLKFLTEGSQSLDRVNGFGTEGRRQVDTFASLLFVLGAVVQLDC